MQVSSDQQSPYWLESPRQPEVHGIKQEKFSGVSASEPASLVSHELQAIYPRLLATPYQPTTKFNSFPQNGSRLGEMNDTTALMKMQESKGGNSVAQQHVTPQTLHSSHPPSKHSRTAARTLFLTNMNLAQTENDTAH